MAEGLIFNLNDASKPLRQLRAPAPSGGITNGDSDGLLLPNQNDQPLTSGDAGVEKVNEQRRMRRGQSTTGQTNSTMFQSLRTPLPYRPVRNRPRSQHPLAYTPWATLARSINAANSRRGVSPDLIRVGACPRYAIDRIEGASDMALFLLVLSRHACDLSAEMRLLSRSSWRVTLSQNPHCAPSLVISRSPIPAR